MNQVLVELDDRTMERLNKVAPPKARKRSEFIRSAIRSALDLLAEREMEEAYRKTPQERIEPDLDPKTWESVGFAKPKRRKQ
jgi:predicted transcriptional regulator